MSQPARRLLTEISSESARAQTPALVPPLPLNPGGVDPLGLRQVNFNLMDRLVPGLNNVATRLRPYVLVTWAWWRAAELARKDPAGRFLPTALKTFVDRVEVAFVGSHLQAGEFDGLLGNDVLRAFLAGADEYAFRRPKWATFQAKRQSTTSLMAPVAYGPSAKVGPGLGFLEPIEDGAFKPTPQAMPAVMAFDEALGEFHAHPLFSGFGDASITLTTLAELHPHWRNGSLTLKEQEVGRERFLAGHTLMGGRQPAASMIDHTLRAASGPLTPADVRRRMAGSIGLAAQVEVVPTSETIWRAIQTRQLFRLSLEALLVWVLQTLPGRPLSLEELAQRLLDETQLDGGASFEGWWVKSDGLVTNPVDRLDAIAQQRRGDDLAIKALEGLRDAVAIADLTGNADLNGGSADRLPLAMAVSRVTQLQALNIRDALEVILSEWIIGQHVYWAIGRNGDDTQRLRLMLEEGGWTSLIHRPTFPQATPDRLAAALSLMADCGLVTRVDGDGEACYRALVP